MNFHIIHSGLFKLDGGAMFGVVPKSIWQRTNPADENNLCTFAARCLLIEDGDRLILIDTGMGDKQPDKFFKHYYPHGGYTLEKSIREAGFSPDEVTDVFLTHLHFDHVGGGVRWKDRANQIPELTFKNATYWSNADHWKWATEPNPREKASFLTENLQPIHNSGQLKFVDINGPSPFSQFDILCADGHTDKQMIPYIKHKGKRIIFAADLLPTPGHIPLPYVMSYDTRPLLTMKEKAEFLDDVYKNEHIIFFEHAAQTECCSLQMTEKGIRAYETFKLKDIL